MDSVLSSLEGSSVLKVQRDRISRPGQWPTVLLSSTRYHPNTSPDSSEVIPALPLLRLSITIETRCRLTLTKVGVGKREAPHIVMDIGYSTLVSTYVRYRVKGGMRREFGAID